MRAIVATLMTILLTACGGGGDDTSSTTQQTVRYTLTGDRPSIAGSVTPDDTTVRNGLLFAGNVGLGQGVNLPAAIRVQVLVTGMQGASITYETEVTFTGNSQGMGMAYRVAVPIGQPAGLHVYCIRFQTEAAGIAIPGGGDSVGICHELFVTGGPA